VGKFDSPFSGENVVKKPIDKCKKNRIKRRYKVFIDKDLGEITDLHFTPDVCQNMIDDAMARLARAPRPFRIFGLDATQDYAAKVASHLDVSLSPITEKYHDDGEPYVKSGPEHSDSTAGNVRGHDVFVIQSLYSDEKESISDKMMKLCIFCGSLKDASSHEVIPIIPHLGWARQDRKTESRAPIATKYIARMLESVGISRVLLFDAHNLAAEQNAFNVPIDNLEAKNIIADWCASNLISESRIRKLKVLSPDSGALGRCERFRNSLLKRLRDKGVMLDDIEIVIFDKLRIKGQVRGGRIIGDVEDADVIAFDDMISTGSTMEKATRAVEDNGGRVWAICATHGLFCGRANEVFDRLDTKVVVTDTIKPFRLSEENKRKLHVVDTTKMVADAVRRIHSGTGSISELLRT
jgi:ribose-phosphate pyrophosphokinase